MTLAGIDDAGGRVGSVMVLPDNGSSTKSQSKTTNDERRTTNDERRSAYGHDHPRRLPRM
jgi:hypothetical protein